MGALIDGLGRRRGTSFAPPFAETLGKIGPEAKRAIPILEEALRVGYPAKGTKDEEFERQEIAHCRSAAALALWRIDRRAAMIPLLTGMVEDKEGRFGGNLFHVRDVHSQLREALN